MLSLSAGTVDEHRLLAECGGLIERLVEEQWVPTFPRARYLVARPEWAAVRGLSVGDFALTVDFVATGAVPAAFPQARDDSRDRWPGLADLDS